MGILPAILCTLAMILGLVVLCHALFGVNLIKVSLQWVRSLHRQPVEDAMDCNMQGDWPHVPRDGSRGLLPASHEGGE